MITLSNLAIKKIKELANENEKYLRITIRGNGCDGIKYALLLDNVYNEDKDTLLEEDDVQIVIDNRSVLYLEGTFVDYYESKHANGFIVNNANAGSGKCNCGSAGS